ncbi:MAG: D-alanyl-D-alanine carboxypeptidase, partial [Deltaproteobacteria bacterium]|nr:D-alanyl-D-alanine carboxypeptidase [Deltaproteobacteria bacterium]
MWLVAVIWAFCLLQPPIAGASQNSPCLNKLSSTDALLLADHDGQIIFKKNEAKKCIPASTLKLLTALAAIHHLGLSYRFKTEFYIDPKQNLKVKG